MRHLEACAVAVVFDKYIDEQVKNIQGSPTTYSERDGYIMRIIGRMAFCHVFMPIFTPSYLKGIGYPGGKQVQHSFEIGWVFDEFQLSCKLGSERRIETIPVIRRGSTSELPPGFHAGNTLDLRSSEGYQQKLMSLAMYIHEKRQVGVVSDLKEFENYWGGEV